MSSEMILAGIPPISKFVPENFLLTNEYCETIDPFGIYEFFVNVEFEQIHTCSSILIGPCIETWLLPLITLCPSDVESVIFQPNMQSFPMTVSSVNLK